LFELVFTAIEYLSKDFGDMLSGNTCPVVLNSQNIYLGLCVLLIRDLTNPKIDIGWYDPCLGCVEAVFNELPYSRVGSPAGVAEARDLSFTVLEVAWANRLVFRL
jgi:hypothetical protein